MNFVAFIGFLWILPMAFAFTFGWVASASEVARECKRVGSFYVAETTYTCKARAAASLAPLTGAEK